MSNAAYATATPETTGNAGLFSVTPFGFRRFWIYFGLGEQVKKVSGLNSLYQLGHVLGQFKNMLNQPQTTFADLAPGVAMVWALLKGMEDDVPVPFESTSRVVREFIQALDKYKAELSPMSRVTPIAGTLHVYRMNDCATRLEAIMAQELDAMPIWFVTKRRAYSIDALIDNAETIFDATMIPLLSSHTTLDIRQSGRAIAFEVPTAAGFHAVRATEAVARGYHEIIIGTRPNEDTPLGPLVNALRNKRDELLACRAIDKEDLLNIVIDMLSRIN
ncbi:MAG: hypothetical protein ABSD96_22180, partial [Candidatus Korobacteraceae bacterium]